ncbi:hypothetical protein [Streptomyces sp. NPDC050856]
MADTHEPDVTARRPYGGVAGNRGSLRLRITLTRRRIGWLTGQSANVPST